MTSNLVSGKFYMSTTKKCQGFFYFSKRFVEGTDFCIDYSTFLRPVSKIFCNFPKLRCFFGSALAADSKKNSTGFQKLIRTVEFLFHLSIYLSSFIT